MNISRVEKYYLHRHSNYSTNIWKKINELIQFIDRFCLTYFINYTRNQLLYKEIEQIREFYKILAETDLLNLTYKA